MTNAAKKAMGWGMVIGAAGTLAVGYAVCRRGAWCAAVCAVGGGKPAVVDAKTTIHDYPLLATLPLEAAARTARRVGDGKVTRARLETRGGRLVWRLELGGNADKFKTVAVEVDAGDGSVVGIWDHQRSHSGIKTTTSGSSEDRSLSGEETWTRR